MSNYANSKLENAWNINPKKSASERNLSDACFKGNEMDGMNCVDSISKQNKSAKDRWNYLLLPCDTYECDNGEYQLSSSLKEIWNDVSFSDFRLFDPVDAVAPKSLETSVSKVSSIQIPQSPNENASVSSFVQTPQTPALNNQCSFSSYLGKKACATYNRTPGVPSNLNYNTNRGRPIMSRGYMVNTNIQIGNVRPAYQVQKAAHMTPEQQKLELFIEQVQLVIKNGFLSPKILKEPIASDTFYLVEMLIHYVTEYGKTRSLSSAGDNPMVYNEMLNDYMRKINLIQKEISICQMQNAEQKRKQQEIVDSYVKEQYMSKFHGQSPSKPHDPTVSGTDSTITNKYEASPSSANAIVLRGENERYVQRQADPFTQQQFVKSSWSSHVYYSKVENSPYSPISPHTPRDGYFGN